MSHSIEVEEYHEYMEHIANQFNLRIHVIMEEWNKANEIYIWALTNNLPIPLNEEKLAEAKSRFL